MPTALHSLWKNRHIGRWLLPCLVTCLLAVAPARAQQVLTVAAYPAVDDIIRATLPRWKQLHPTVEVRLTSRPYAEHHAAMATALASSAGLPDLMAVEFGHIGKFASTQKLENLGSAPYSVRGRQLRFVPFAFRQGVDSSGAIHAIPSDIGPGTLLYRTDLLQRAGVSEAELNGSWESFIASGTKIKAKTGAYLLANARDIKDIVIRTDVGSSDSAFSYWRPGQGIFLDRRGKVLVDTPRFVRAFELAKKVRELKLDAQIGTWSKEWTDGFKNGTVATQMSGAWLAGHLANWMAPETRGLWRATQLPEKAWASWGGTFYAIPKGAANKSLAWEFAQLMTLDPEVQINAFKAHDAFPALVAVHDDAFFSEPIAFLGGQKARLLWREAASRINPIEAHPLDPVAEEIVSAELDLVLEKGKSVAAALADAKQRIEQQLAR